VSASHVSATNGVDYRPRASAPKRHNERLEIAHVELLAAQSEILEAARFACASDCSPEGVVATEDQNRPCSLASFRQRGFSSLRKSAIASEKSSLGSIPPTRRFEYRVQRANPGREIAQ
jgi:hypothetical protein